MARRSSAQSREGGRVASLPCIFFVLVRFYPGQEGVLTRGAGDRLRGATVGPITTRAGDVFPYNTMPLVSEIGTDGTEISSRTGVASFGAFVTPPPHLLGKSFVFHPLLLHEFRHYPLLFLLPKRCTVGCFVISTAAAMGAGRDVYGIETSWLLAKFHILCLFVDVKTLGGI